MAQHQVDQLKTGIWSVKEFTLKFRSTQIFLITNVRTSGQKKI